MSALGKLVPLILLFAFVGAFGWIGYQMYLFSQELKERGMKKMEKKNVVFTKDGMKVHVKDVKDEQIADKIQSNMVKTWNASSFPNYQSKLWDNGAQPKGKENAQRR